MVSSVWLDVPTPGAVARARVRSLADVREIERTAQGNLLPAWSILGLIEYWAASAPGKPAIVVADKDDATRAVGTRTYAELAGMVRATANRVWEVSGGAPPVVTILTPLIAEALIGSWAGATAGIANPINPFLRVDHVAEIMNAAGTTVLLAGTPADGPGAWNDVDKLRAMVPTLRAVWFVGDAAGVDSFRRQVSAADQAQLAFRPSLDPNRTSALLHTGGTTAAPKLVRLTPQGHLLNAWCCGAWISSQPDEVVALGMPYFHVGGATVSALAAIVFGQTLVIVSPDGYRSPRVVARFWDMVNAHGVTLALSAPTTAAALVAGYTGAQPPARFGYWSGGSAVPVQLAREFADKFGVGLREVWGMTELHGCLVANPAGAEPRLGSIGIPFPYHEVRSVPLGARTADAESPAGETGVLAVSGPCVTPGYLDEARSRELYFRADTPGARWLNTGDLCTTDSDGYVSLRGRSKDLIIRGGHNIDPLAIEAALITHPAVLYAAAVGEPDRDKGELPVVYVQLRPGASANESDLLTHCQRELTERAAVPRSVRIVDAMPLTAVGKIFKPALRLDAVRRCVRAVASQVDTANAVDSEVREGAGAITVVLRATGPGATPVAEKLRRELERYTFRVEVESVP